MFGDQQATAIVLIPIEQPEEAVHVVLLVGKDEWKVRQYAGRSGAGPPKLRRAQNPGASYVTIEYDESGNTSRLWRCDAGMQKLVAIDCSGHGTVSGGILTSSGRGGEKTFFLLRDHGQDLLGGVSGREIRVSRAEGRTEVWRLNEVSGGTGTGRALYTLWMSDDPSTPGRDVARIETDWHAQREPYIMKHLATRLIGLTARQYRGVWDDEPDRTTSDETPISLIVRGSDSIVEMLKPASTENGKSAER